MDAIVLYPEVGKRSDPASETGSLHAKIAFGLLKPFTPYGFGGNGKDGDVTISTNTTIGGIKQYNSLTVNAGVTLTCETGTIILVKDTLTVNGLITASGKGGAGSNINTMPGSDGAGWAGSGGGGGARYYNTENKSPGSAGGETIFPRGAAGVTNYGGNGGGTTYQGWGLDALAGAKGGGGGCAGGSSTYSPGGAGGGLIIVEAMSIIISSTGAIRADGINGQNGALGDGGGGGGGGGVLIINCDFYANAGVVSASAGVGGVGGGYANPYYGYNGGNGGPGLLGVIYRRVG